MESLEEDFSLGLSLDEPPQPILSWAEIQLIDNTTSAGTTVLKKGNGTLGVETLGVTDGADATCGYDEMPELLPLDPFKDGREIGGDVELLGSHEQKSTVERRVRFHIPPDSDTDIDGESSSPLTSPLPSSPISILPLELLGTIFLYCFPTGTLFPFVPGLTTPLTLCKVCTHWNAVASRLPALWSNVTLEGQEMFYLRASIAKIGRWFARCQPSAFEGADTGTGVGLTLHIRCTPEPWFRQARQQIAETLVLPHASRLRSLTLLSTAIYAPYLTGPPAGIFPSLEVLHLADHTASMADARAVDAMTVFGELPRLRVYRHSSKLAGGHVSSMPVFVPWGQLKVLDLGGTWVSLHTCWEVLFQCRRLAKCTLQVVSCRCAPPHACGYPETHVVFPHLRRFDVSIHGPDDCTVLLGRMTVPKLKEFSYTADVWSHAAFMRLSDRSRLPVVLRTVLISGECTGAEAFEVLRCHPQLVEAVFLKGAVFGRGEMEEIGRGEIGKDVGVLYCGAEETGTAVSMLITRSGLGVEVAEERGGDKKCPGDRESGKGGKGGRVARLSKGAIRVPEVPTADQLVQLKRVQEAKQGGEWFALHVESRAPVI